MVVEDDDSMRESIERHLGEAGFACAAFASADALLARGVDAQALCVISDLRLPSTSGLELPAALHQRELSTPFILITAHDKPGLREMALHHGAAALLAQPFSATALLQAVRGAIGLNPHQ